MENEYCLEQTKKNFDAVKNGELRKVLKLEPGICDISYIILN